MPDKQDIPVMGIDLAPLGWQELRDGLTIQNDRSFIKKEKNHLVLADVTGEELPDGSVAEIFVLASMERMPDKTTETRFYRIRNGVLLLAGLMINPELKEKTELKANIDEEDTAGVLAPSPEDAKRVIGVLSQIRTEKNEHGQA